MTVAHVTQEHTNTYLNVYKLCVTLISVKPAPASPRVADKLPRVLAALTAELEALLSDGQTGRITLNISTGHSVRMEVAKFSTIDLDETH